MAQYAQECGRVGLSVRLSVSLSSHCAHNCVAVGLSVKLSVSLSSHCVRNCVPVGLSVSLSSDSGSLGYCSGSLRDCVLTGLSVSLSKCQGALGHSGKEPWVELWTGTHVLYTAEDSPILISLPAGGLCTWPFCFPFQASHWRFPRCCFPCWALMLLAGCCLFQCFTLCHYVAPINHHHIARVLFFPAASLCHLGCICRLLTPSTQTRSPRISPSRLTCS